MADFAHPRSSLDAGALFFGFLIARLMVFEMGGFSSCNSGGVFMGQSGA